jgi:hypothetical protein
MQWNRQNTLLISGDDPLKVRMIELNEISVVPHYTVMGNTGILHKASLLNL